MLSAERERVRDVASGSGFYSLPAMWAIRSHTRLLYPNSLSYLSGEKAENGSTPWRQILELHPLEPTVPCDQLDEVVVEGDACASIKDGGVAVAVEVRGHDLRGTERRRLVQQQDLAVQRGQSERANTPGAPCSPGCPSWGRQQQPSQPS